MRSEVMRTASTFLSLCLGYHSPCRLSFVSQVVMDSVSGHRKTEAGLLGEPASFSHPLFMAVEHCFRRLCCSPPEFIPWQRASGSVGPLTHPLMLQLVKTEERHLISPRADAGRRRPVRALNR